MTLRQKTLLVIAVTFVLLFVVLYQVSKRAMHGHTERAEQLIARENMARVRQGLSARFAPMGAIAANYARWDDAYRFVEDGNRAFYETNLVDSVLSTMHADAVLFLRADGKVIFATGFDQDTGKKVALPAGFLSHWQPDRAPLKGLSGAQAEISGWLSLPNSLMFVEARPITRSDGGGPVRGYLVLGSRWTEKQRRELEKSVNLGFSMTPWQSGEARAVNAHLQTPQSLWVQSRGMTMSSYARLDNIFGAPVLVMRADGRRDLFFQEEIALSRLKWSLFVVGIAFCCAMMIKMDYLVLRRLRWIVGDLQTIGQSAHEVQPGARVRVAGGDELGHLAKQINFTLDALQSAQHQHERTVANVPGVVARMVVDSQGEHLLTFVGEGSRELLGLEWRTLRANPHLFIEALHPEDCAGFKQSWRDALASLEDWNWVGRLRQNVAGQGSNYIWVQGVARSEKLATGEVAWDGLLLDITDRKRVEESLRQAHDELEQRVVERTDELSQANRLLTGEVVERQMVMATLRETVRQLEHARAGAESANRAKSEFLSRMSHELRTPLNAILGFAQLLENDVQAEEEKESVEHILGAGRHLLSLINEVLDIASIEAGRLTISLEPVPVSETIEETVALVRSLTDAQKVSVLYTGGVLRAEGAAAMACGRGQYIFGDRQRLKQVLLNLLSNAVKYNHAGGEVRVGFTVENDRVRITVRDTGMGIASDKISRLFTPFDRLDAEQTGIEGTGIGLVLSKRLVELMDGTIGFESQAGQGSTFWVEFQAASSPELAIDEPVKEEFAPTPDTRTVLYIEDNQPNLRLVQRCLERVPGITLLTATHASKGLELAHLHHPHLILLDVHLPDFDGDEVLRRLKTNPATRDIPVIVISADATNSQIKDLREAGAVDYLTKPLDLRKFLKVVHENLFDQQE